MNRSVRRDLLDLMAAVGGELPSAGLVRAGDVLGHDENAVRVALSRLRARGTVLCTRRGWYRLGPEAANLAHQVASWRSLESRLTPRWQGGWVAAMSLPAPRRAARARERALRLLGLRELVPRLAVRPDNLVGGVQGVRQQLAELTEGLVVFALDQLAPEEERRARGLWDPPPYVDLLRELEVTRSRLPQLPLDEAARVAFELGGRVIHALAFDPLLPGELVDGRSRRRLVEQMRRFDAEGRSLWQRVVVALEAA